MHRSRRARVTAFLPTRSDCPCPRAIFRGPYSRCLRGPHQVCPRRARAREVVRAPFIECPRARLKRRSVGRCPRRASNCVPPLRAGQDKCAGKDRTNMPARKSKTRASVGKPAKVDEPVPSNGGPSHLADEAMTEVPPTDATGQATSSAEAIPFAAREDSSYPNGDRWRIWRQGRISVDPGWACCPAGVEIR